MSGNMDTWLSKASQRSRLGKSKSRHEQPAMDIADDDARRLKALDNPYILISMNFNGYLLGAMNIQHIYMITNLTFI